MRGVSIPRSYLVGMVLRTSATSLVICGTVTIEHTRSRLELYLWDNLLTKLPSALFQLTNLGVLSLRKNQLTHLPAAIGELRHLRELNIGGNALTYLPAEIQQLQLDTFTYVPNPFVCVPPGSLLETRHVHGLSLIHI